MSESVIAQVIRELGDATRASVALLEDLKTLPCKSPKDGDSGLRDLATSRPPTVHDTQYGEICSFAHQVKHTLDDLERVDDTLHTIRTKIRQQVAKRRFASLESKDQIIHCPIPGCGLESTSDRRKKLRTEVDTTYRCTQGHQWHAHQSADDILVVPKVYEDGNTECMLCCESSDDDHDMFSADT